MGNTGLLRCEAEMTLLQPHLGDIRHQELRNSPFWPSSMFKSQLVKGEKTSSSNRAPKESQGFALFKTSPFVVPTTRKETSTGNAPQGATPPKAVTNHFPQSLESKTKRASRGCFRPHSRGRGRGHPPPTPPPPPHDSSIASLSPPVVDHLRFFRRDWQINKCSESVLNIITNGYRESVS